MNSLPALPYAAAAMCALLMMAALLRRRRSLATWFFGAGMGTLALETLLVAQSFSAQNIEDAIRWQRLTFLAKSCLPGIWLLFSLTYSRGNFREFLSRWRIVLVLAFLLPAVVLLQLSSGIVSVPTETGEAIWFSLGPAGRIITALLLVGFVFILTNLEKTFRAAVGTMRWRIKFVVLGLGLIFGARIYTRSQALLFSRHDPNLIMIEAGALIVGGCFIAIAYWRTGFAESDVYPSRAALQSSVTVLIAGAYLFVVGVLAQIVAAFGGDEYFQLQTMVVLVGVAALAALLLSDRFRQRLHRFVSRHFKRPQHDFQKIWRLFTARTADVTDETALSEAAAKLISETFDVLAVTVWLYDSGSAERLRISGSTSQTAHDHKGNLLSLPPEGEWLSGSQPFDLEDVNNLWAETLRLANPTQFPHGGRRVAIPLRSGQVSLGVCVLADRVGGAPYMVEEFDLLQCIGEQFSASLLRLRLATEIMRARELETFQTVSAFFVHDLKNAASSLTLTLKNLPLHFDDPAFREDALRAIRATVDRINSVTNKLGVFRGKLQIQRNELDLNELITKTIAGLNGMSDFPLTTDLQPIPPISADHERLQSVMTNLLLNARDAVAEEGEVTVHTCVVDRRVILAVSDTGCGMSSEFLRRQLFRPFQTTKKHGIGIGMFQTKAIVEAHGGTIEAESEPGQGSTFRVSLPITAREE